MLERKTISVEIQGEYLLRSCDRSDCLLVGFHGYGENAREHLEQLERIPGVDGWHLCAMEALHPFYRRRTNQVVGCWMTRRGRKEAIASNLKYVQSVIPPLLEQWSISRLVYTGFSQGVAMAWRSAAVLPGAGLISLAGDIPPELTQSQLAQVRRGLIARGQEDTWYSDRDMQKDLKRLEQAGVDVRPVVFEGGHEWPVAFMREAAMFLEEIRSDSKDV